MNCTVPMTHRRSPADSTTTKKGERFRPAMHPMCNHTVNAACEGATMYHRGTVDADKTWTDQRGSRSRSEPRVQG
eukprot:32981-Eustigmatos_ZCMA.PRE.1